MRVRELLRGGDGRVGNIGAAMAVGCRGEVRGRILPDEVDRIDNACRAHRQRATLVVASLNEADRWT